MSDRRKGTTIFWEFFWKAIYGERRSGMDRRNWFTSLINTTGCGGHCDQGRRACDCILKKGTDMNREIFVFGANEAGRHGAGAALHARLHHGAIYGQGEGLQGNSYGIPTKDARIQTLPLHIIAIYVKHFKEFAAEFPALIFRITPIGCGLAGYTPADIAPLFEGCPPNCILPAEFGGPGEPWKPEKEAPPAKCVSL